MKKEVKWLSSRCIYAVLLELAKKPLTPMQLRAKTGFTKNNYINIILKRLRSEKIVKCLNPKEKIGRIFCINPEYAKIVKKVFRKKKINQKVNSLPDIDWLAYGRLACPYCTQLRKVFNKANLLRVEGRTITPYTIMEKLPDMATSDVYRALNKLAQLNLLIKHKEKPRKFMFNSNGLKIIEYDPEILI